MDAVSPTADVFIVAQGLLMYLEPATLPALFANICCRFPAAEMVFDAVPRWFSRLTLLGLDRTPHYRLPPMPWGINRDEIEPAVRRWVPTLGGITFLAYQMPRGWPQVVAGMVHHVPFVRNEIPSLVHVALASDTVASNITHLRKKPMVSMTNVIDAAARNVSSGSKLSGAASQIIAKRVALGVAAVFDPARADHAEFGRMVPEKMKAFSAAGIIMVQQAVHAQEQISRFASEAIKIATRATFTIAGSGSPVAMAPIFWPSTDRPAPPAAHDEDQRSRFSVLLPSSTK
jgi:hypothetical protein